MEDNFKKPTVGRIVHFYPNKGDITARQNFAEFIPAIVVQTFPNSGEGDMANLHIFPFGPGNNLLRCSVHHKSSTEVQGSIPKQEEGAVESGEPTMEYWVYPPIV